MGRGMGTGPGMMPAPQPLSPEQEIEMLRQQLEQIQRRLDELEKKKG